MYNKTTNKTINKWIKKEFKRMKKEKKECAKLYPDWQDDEYNMLHHKFIWALPNQPDITPSFNTINKATLTYDRKTQQYDLYVDFYQYIDMSDPKAQETVINYLREVKEALATYVYALDENQDGKIVFPCLSLEDIAYPFSGRNPLEIYTKLTFLLYGFKEFYN